MLFRLSVSLGLTLILGTTSILAPRAMAEPLPVVIVALPSIDALLERMDYLANVAGFADAPQVKAVRAGMEQFARGIDRQRPSVILLQADDDSFQVFSMVPITDVAEWLQVLPLIGGSVTDLDDGNYQVQVGSQTLFLAADEDWAYVTRSADALPLRPTDPLETLEGLDRQYDLAVRFIVQNIPEEPREYALSQYRRVMQMALAQAAQSDAPQAEFQRANMEQQFAELQRFVDEADLVTLGVRVNPAQHAILADFLLTAVTGSRLDRRMAVTDKAVTSLGGFFFPKATATASICHPLLPEDAENQQEQLAAVLALAQAFVAGDEFPGSDVAKQELSSVLVELGEIARETLAGGRVDWAVTLVTGTEPLNLIGASRMAGGDRWNSILAKLQEVAKEMEIPADVRLAFSREGDVTFHAAQLPLPESPTVSRALGEKLTVYLGVSADTMYLGIGEKSLAGLKKAIAASGDALQPAPPVRGVLSLGGIVEYVAHVMEHPDAAAVAAAFRQEGENAHVRLSQKLDPRHGLATRLEIQDGVVAAVGRAIRERAESR